MTFPELLDFLHDFIWGLLVDWILYVGIFLSLGFNAIPLRQLPFGLIQALRSRSRGRSDDRSDGSITAYAALMTATGANIGTGSLAGIAFMLNLGGPGSLFWMWMATLVNISTKFAEILLAVQHRSRNDRGELVAGPMYYIQHGLGPAWRWMAILFAIMGTIGAFGLGNGVQAVELSKSVHLLVGLPSLLTGFLLAACSLWILMGGICRVSRISSIVVPLMVLFYLVATVFLLAHHLELMPQTMRTIFSDAFNPRSVAGGTIFMAISAGVRRAVFAQEIGMGTSPIVHGIAAPQDPILQGMVATLAPLLTALVGTMTGLIIITSQSYLANQDGITMLNNAFEWALSGASSITYISNLLFTFTTIIAFGYYGERCLEFLFGSRTNLPFRLVWCATIVISSVTGSHAIWQLTEILNALMALPNLLALVMLSAGLFQLTKSYRFSLR